LKFAKKMTALSCSAVEIYKFDRTSHDKCLSTGYLDMHGVTRQTRLVDLQRVPLAYQPPVSSTFLSEQISRQQSANSTFSQNKSAPATSQTNRLLLASRAGELAMGGRALPRRRDEFLRACAAGTDLGINLGTFLLHMVSHSLIVLPQIRRRDCGGWIRPRLAEWTITVEMGSQKRLCLFDRSY
jgi:hypothetical protein